MQSVDTELPTRPALGATILVPEPARAALVLLQGAGVHDRDGAMRHFSFPSKLYLRLAEKLAARGFASLRYDKRGALEPPDGTFDYSVASRVDDALAAVVLAQGRRELSGLPLFVAGHSEGGLVALKAARSQVAPRLAGVACLASPFGDLFGLMRARARARLDVPDSSQRERAARVLEFLDVIEALFRAGASPEPAEFRAIAEPWRGVAFDGWESFEWLRGHWAGELEPVAAAGVPALVVQGDRDARLTPQTPGHWKDWCAASGAEFRLIEGMGHDLNDARRKAFVISEDVIEALAGWMGRVLQGGHT
jgi:alpha-beta hydrolase superfamily lysophospholipase